MKEFLSNGHGTTPRCQTILAKGFKQGLQCNNGAMKGSTLCGPHTKSPVTPDPSKEGTTMAQTLIQKLASVDIGSVLEVTARKNFKDAGFTPVGPGGSTPTTAVVVGKKGNVLTLEFAMKHQAALIFNFDVKKDITFKVLSTPAPKETTIATKATPATIALTGPLTTFMLFFVSIFSRTATKTQFLVRSETSIEADGIVTIKDRAMNGFLNTEGADYCIYRSEDGTTKGGFNITTGSTMKKVTDWTLVRSQDLPFIVAGTGSRGLKLASQEIKDRAVAATTASLEALKLIHGDKLRVMSGMAEGFDELIAMVAIKLEIKLIAAVPNKGYGAYYWANHSLTGTNRMGHFNGIIARADKVINVMEDVHGIQRGLYLNGRHSNFLRNDYMVAQANHFLVWDPSSSGTADCFSSIREAGKTFEILSGDNDSCPTPRPAAKVKAEAEAKAATDVPTIPTEPNEAV
jgi:hypothetical protein